MSAAELIEQIKALPPAEWKIVYDWVFEVHDELLRRLAE